MIIGTEAPPRLCAPVPRSRALPAIFGIAVALLLGARVASTRHADFDAALSHDARHVLSLYGRGLAKWRTGDASGAAADINAARKRLADVAAVAGKFYGVVAERDLQSRVALAFTEENPMIFAIARGGADACVHTSRLLLPYEPILVSANIIAERK